MGLLHKGWRPEHSCKSFHDFICQPKPSYQFKFSYQIFTFERSMPFLVEYLFLLMHNIILYRDFCGSHSLIKNLKSPTKSRFFAILALDTTTLITLITPVFYQQPTSTEPRLRLKDWEVSANTVGKLDRQNSCK